MYLIQQAELVVDNKFRNNHLTKCTTSTTTTMKQEENHDFTRKNGLNGNISVAESTSSSQPHSTSTIALDQIPVINTVAAATANHHATTGTATSSSGRNGDHQLASSMSPHDLTTNNNNALRNHNNNNNNNSNNKKASSIGNFFNSGINPPHSG